MISHQLLVIFFLAGLAVGFEKYQNNIEHDIVKLSRSENILDGIEKNYISREKEPSLYEWTEKVSFKIQTFIGPSDIGQKSYDLQFENLKQFFTPKGYADYDQALKKSGIREVLEKGDITFASFERDDRPVRAYIVEPQDKKNGEDWIVNVPGRRYFSKKETDWRGTFDNVVVSIFIKKDGNDFKITQVIIQKK